jgi:hypothetical protein
MELGTSNVKLGGRVERNSQSLLGLQVSAHNSCDVRSYFALKTRD